MIKNLLVASLVAIMCISCTTATIQTNKLPDYNEKAKKIYVTITASEGSRVFINHLSFQLEKQLKEKGVEIGFYQVDPLSLELQDNLEEKIKAYNPDILMVIKQTERTLSANNPHYGNYGTTETGTTLDLIIFPKNSSNKPVWRGNLKASAQFGLETASIKAAKRIVDALLTDGVI